MIGLITVLYLLFSHWVADFLFQTTEMGTGKSKSLKILLKHTGIYALTMLLMSSFLLELTVSDILIFGLVTFVFHTVQDWATSRLTSTQFAKNRYNGWDGAFTIIGFDQFLHYLQILITYQTLINRHF